MIPSDLVKDSMSMEDKHRYLSGIMETDRSWIIDNHERLGIKIKNLRWEIEY